MLILLLRLPHNSLISSTFQQFISSLFISWLIYNDANWKLAVFCLSLHINFFNKRYHARVVQLFLRMKQWENKLLSTIKNMWQAFKSLCFIAVLCNTDLNLAETGLYERNITLEKLCHHHCLSCASFLFQVMKLDFNCYNHSERNDITLSCLVKRYQTLGLTHNNFIRPICLISRSYGHKYMLWWCVL